MPSPTEAAHGHWPSILMELGGLSADQLTNQHQPCPSCGGSDRYRWDSDDGDGSWFCNQCGGKNRQGGGGNGLDLLMRVRRWSFAEACEQLERYLGLPSKPSSKAPRRPYRQPSAPPPNTPAPPLNRGAIAQWCYRDAEGHPLFYIQRIALRNGGKAFLHRVWLDNAWHRPSRNDPFTCDWPAPRPLLNLHAIAANPDAHIILTEGEKASDAAQRLFPIAVASTWPNGAKALDKADLSPLVGRSCILWPDNDPVGLDCMDRLAQRLLALGAAQVRIVTQPTDAPAGWDLADATWSPEEAQAYIRTNLSKVTAEPTQISPGSFWPFVRENYGVDISRHDLSAGRALPPPCNTPPSTTQRAKQPKLTDPQKIQSLRAMAGKLLEEKTPFADRVPLLRARAQELDITLRDGELNRLIWDARRAAAGAVDGLGPGDLISLSPTPWHWEGVLMPEALNLLLALPKVGKTSLMLAMIAAWHRGEGSFLGLPFYGPCPPVLIVGTDQPDNDWGRMLQEVGLLPDGTISAPIVRLFHRGSPLHLSPEGIEAIAVYASSHPKLFVLLDSIAALTSPLGLDENSAEIVEPINDLMEALEPHGATVVAIHHASKGRSGESATLASRGSTALPAAASQIISLGRVATGRPGEPQDRRLVLKTEGRAGMPQHLLIERTEDGWISHGSADAVALAQRLLEVEEKLTDRQADALELVREQWGQGNRMDAKGLVRGLKLKGADADRIARRTLDTLVRKGCLRSVNETTLQGRVKWWSPVEGDRTPSRGGMCYVSEPSEVSDPLKDQEEGSNRSKKGKDTSDTEDTQETPPRESVRTPHLPQPWHADALRLHRERPDKAAFTVALELGPLGYRNIQGWQVAELWEQTDAEITPPHNLTPWATSPRSDSS